MSKFWFLLILMGLSEVLGGPLKNCPGRYQLDPAVTRFRRYLQIDTSKEENIKRAVEFWREQAIELGLPFQVYKPGGLPICVLTLVGTEPSLPSIMLNSHMDVVPADENEWTYQPFSAYMDAKGDIYARGSQDAKDVSCMYVEAIRRLKQDKVELRRTLHVTFMPDEETGGFRGMKEFVKTEAFKAMNVGFALDEGLPSADGTLYALYQDKRPWQIRVTTHGEGGHGSGMPDNTALDKARRFINVVDAYRARMKAVARSVQPTDYGAYTSLNVNMMNGGIKPNIVPSYYNLIMDIRLAVEANVTEVEKMIQSWIAEAGSDTELTFIRREDVSKMTVLDESNPYWVAMQGALNEINLEINPVVCAGTTDSLVLRNMGIPSVGFSPTTFTPPRAHATNEYLNAGVFLEGIDMMCEVLRNLGYLPSFELEEVTAEK